MINHDQIIYNDRIYQRENIYNNILDPKIYLSRYLNMLLRSIVETTTNYANKVIGCDPFFVDIINNNIKFVISPGRIIIDSTLIEIFNPLFLDIQLNRLYKTIVILAGYRYLNNDNKASFQICFLDEENNTLVTNGTDLLTNGVNIVILGKFELEYRDDNLVQIYQPYGLFRKQHYSQFLINTVSSQARAINNKIFTLLHPKAELYRPFYIGSNLYNISIPLYLDFYWDGISRLFNDKLRSRYMIYDLENYYFTRFDHNIQRRTEIMHDQYSYAL